MNVKKNANVISITFLRIDSFDTNPKKIPRKIMQIAIIRNDIMNIGIPALRTKKNGSEGIIPPTRGAVPFTNDTIILVNFSAFS